MTDDPRNRSTVYRPMNSDILDVCCVIGQDIDTGAYGTACHRLPIRYLSFQFRDDYTILHGLCDYHRSEVFKMYKGIKSMSRKLSRDEALVWAIMDG